MRMQILKIGLAVLVLTTPASAGVFGELDSYSGHVELGGGATSIADALAGPDEKYVKITVPDGGDWFSLVVQFPVPAIYP